MFQMLEVRNTTLRGSVFKISKVLDGAESGKFLYIYKAKKLL